MKEVENKYNPGKDKYIHPGYHNIFRLNLIAASSTLGSLCPKYFTGMSFTSWKAIASAPIGQKERAHMALGMLAPLHRQGIHNKTSTTPSDHRFLTSSASKLKGEPALLHSKCSTCHTSITCPERSTSWISQGLAAPSKVHSNDVPISQQ